MTIPTEALTSNDLPLRATVEPTARPSWPTPSPSLAGGIAWTVATAGLLVAGSLTVARWPEARLRAAPLFGSWGVEVAGHGLAIVPALVLAELALVHAPRLAATLPWRRLLLAAGAGTVAWSVALAITAGGDRLGEPLEGGLEYLAVVDDVHSPTEFLRTFGERVDGYPLHIKGHPPGMALVVWALDAVGLGGPGWAAALVIAGAGVATAAVLVTLRSVAGEDAARCAAPFVALAPAALWLATSADAFYAGVGAVGIALVVAGSRPRHHLAGGIVLGAAAFLSYGLVLLAVIPLAVALWRSDLRPLVWAGLGSAAVAGGFAALGFWWFDGLGITRGFYWDGVATNRHGVLFATVVNPGALALATGPAVTAALFVLASRARSRARARPHAGTHPRSVTGMWRWDTTFRSQNEGVLPAAALVAVTVANLSQLSRGEVERIWLPFTVFLLTATALLPRRQVRGWLAAQLALAVVVEVAHRGGW
jgi:methylthioxylose transferase